MYEDYSILNVEDLHTLNSQELEQWHQTLKDYLTTNFNVNPDDVTKTIKNVFCDERGNIKESEYSLYRMIGDLLYSSSKIFDLLSLNGEFLQYCPEGVKANFQFARLAMCNNGNSIRYVNENILSNPKLAAQLILSTMGVGYPCETLKSMGFDRDYLQSVANEVIAISLDKASWVNEHMQLVSYSR